MTSERAIPLKSRPLDIAILLFFVVNILFITYIVDLEQIVIEDPSNFEYPVWPPAPLVDLVHWWGKTFDPVQYARPVWWRMTIWIDALFFGPFYLFAIYAYVRGKPWIRVPSFLYAAVMITNVTIILGEELMGPHATPSPGLVVAVNLPWLIFPLLIIYRMWRDPHPFVKPAQREQEPAA